MRLASFAFLRRVAAMSSYARRGYPRAGRGYSARSAPPYPNAGAELVDGDSHHGAVRAANDALRRGGPPSYRQGPRHQPYDYRQPQQQAPMYRPVPYNYGQPQQQATIYGSAPYNYAQPQQHQHQPPPPGPQYGFGAPYPYFHGHAYPQPHGYAPPNGGFRPAVPQLTPRLADYRRRWRFAKQRPPHQIERFKVLSYNILADYLAQEHRFLYERIPSFILEWKWRKEKLVFEFGLWSPDILCLQEVDRFTDLEQEMTRRGYNGIWKMRTGDATDGCAIFWRTARFQLRHEEAIEFNKLGLRDNVAQLCVLESVVPRSVQTDATDASLSHQQQAKQVVVCNTHVLYNPKRGDIKLGQVRTLLDRAYSLSKTWNDAPVIICGDFNSTPKSPLYNFVLEQKLNLSGLAKSTVSGQHTSPSPQGLYTGSNRFRQPFYPTNSREGNTSLQNDHKPQIETTKLVESSFPAGQGHVLTDTSSEPGFNADPSNSCGNKEPYSDSTNLDEQKLPSCLESPGQDRCTSDADVHATKTEGREGTATGNSSEGCFVRIKTESGEERDITDVPFAPATVCSEILQSGSSEIVDSSHLLSSDESFGLQVLGELVGGTNKADVHRDLSGDVISEDFACDFEENEVQSDELLVVSKGNPDEKQNVTESMLSDKDNCTTSESESSHFSGSNFLSDPLPQMSNVRLEGENSTLEATHSASPGELVHQSNGAVSDACDNQCTPELLNKHSVSCRDESEKNARASEDARTANEILCTDVNSDPSFFEELTGGNHSLLAEEDQLLATSHGSPSPQQMVASNGRYYYYDPYKWAPEEIKAATGNEDCTYLEHNLKLRSVYTDVEDFDGTKDANKEPLVTSYHRKFMGTVDYVWASEDLQTVQVLDTFPKEILNQTIGFPTKKWGSDHIALVCELAFTK